ncbi:MAG: hypothetical protein ACN4GF_04225, partial [Lentimonas sp.]
HDGSGQSERAQVSRTDGARWDDFYLLQSSYSARNTLLVAVCVWPLGYALWIFYWPGTFWRKLTGRKRLEPALPFKFDREDKSKAVPIAVSNVANARRYTKKESHVQFPQDTSSANLELITDGFRLNFSTSIEQPTGITLNSFNEEENLSFSRILDVAPITRDRNGTSQYLYTEEFLLTEEELLPFVDQPLDLVALYENFTPVSMEANISVIPEPRSALFLGISALLLVANRARTWQ